MKTERQRFEELLFGLKIMVREIEVMLESEGPEFTDMELEYHMVQIIRDITRVQEANME